MQSDIRKIGVASETRTVLSRLNGPPAGGNGDHSRGVLGTRFDGPVAVSLRRPVPPDEPFEIRDENDGALRAFADGELVVEAVAARPRRA